jgi:hypothetical protein
MKTDHNPSLPPHSLTHWYATARAEPTALRASLEYNAPVGSLRVTEGPPGVALTDDMLWSSRVTIVNSSHLPLLTKAS